MSSPHTIDAVVKTILAAYPDAQAVYRFGSWGTPYQRADSDLDIAVLLPHHTAKRSSFTDWVSLNGEIAYISHTDRVDLVNLRKATTDMQAEIIRTGDVVFCVDDDKRAEFEALALIRQHDLNARRAALYRDRITDARAARP